jgi:hypothetical protein
VDGEVCGIERCVGGGEIESAANGRGPYSVGGFGDSRGMSLQ